MPGSSSRPRGVVVIDAAGQPAARRAAPPDHPSASPTSPCGGWCSPTITPITTSARSCSRKAGARVIAHPDRRSLAAEGGEDALIADWVRVVGLDAMRGFEFADVPDRPVTTVDTLRLGGRAIVITHPGAGHSAGDLLVWLPKERVLFAGDVLVEDGVTHGGGRKRGRAAAGARRGGCAARDRRRAGTRRDSTTAAGADRHRPASISPVFRRRCARRWKRRFRCAGRSRPCRRRTTTRPVSLNSRRRRNAARVYVEEERKYMGLDAP